MGDVITDEGEYSCVSCGFQRHFEPGDFFTEYASCLAGTDSGPEDYIDGLEMWEKVDVSEE